MLLAHLEANEKRFSLCIWQKMRDVRLSWRSPFLSKDGNDFGKVSSFFGHVPWQKDKRICDSVRECVIFGASPATQNG